MDILENRFKQRVFNVNHSQFNGLAMEIFYYQAKYNPVYAKFLQLIDKSPEKITDWKNIPCMPVEFFKDHDVSCKDINEHTFYFTSSSTTGVGTSRHYLHDTGIYDLALTRSFEYRFGEIRDYTFRFLLPSYLDRNGSSLVYMARHLIDISGKGDFYLSNFKKLSGDLEKDNKKNNKVLLLGVSFALMDFAIKFPMDLSAVIVMETGGMKGRREEITRHELHSSLKKLLNNQSIASEYGMTELLSQAYSIKEGIFNCPPWMKIRIGQTTDPFAPERKDKTGRIKIVDLANIESCCFLSTSDLGRVFDDGSFEVLGRFDDSDIRGCNLMYDES